ncbi:MAG: DUF1674 domain-containing protein [Proteobacteria bacterium]|nr:DUF1674 domain-containing protein [Pseudomonadota bacterium]
MISQTPNETAAEDAAAPSQPLSEAASHDDGKAPPREFGGREGLDPTRYGDWEKNGRCIDF